MKQFKNAINILFIGLVFGLLLTGLVRTIFFPKEINEYENRYANRLSGFSLSRFLDGSFQDEMEAALGDQVQYAEEAKELYNGTVSSVSRNFAAPVIELAPRNIYVDYGKLRLFGGTHLCYPTRVLADHTEKFDAKTENYNQVFANYPEADFYAYYIEKDTDINFETGEKLGASEYIGERLNLPEGRYGQFSIDSFKQYRDRFFRTDHHWNFQGSYDAYLQLVDLLGAQGEPLVPGQLERVADGCAGSKTTTPETAEFTETFWAYLYHFPEMSITINGQPAEDYGRAQAYVHREEGLPPLRYSGFYGGDDGEVVFDTGTCWRGNLLVLGESYDNAVVKLLATHYDKLFAVDLRYYEHFMGKPFDLDSYLLENQIDRVLLIGNIDFWTMQEFSLDPVRTTIPEDVVAKYTKYNGALCFNGNYLVFSPRVLEKITYAIDPRLANYNKVMAAMPDTEFYLYYIEKDTDIQFEKGERRNLFEYIAGGLDLTEDHIGHLPCERFSDFTRYFNHTDPHWSYRGAYKAYCDLVEMLGAGEPLRPLERVAISHRYLGTKASGGNFEAFRETFYGYRFDYPEMNISFYGRGGRDYGNQDKMFENAPVQSMSYGGFFGADIGEVIFDTGREELDNIIVFGESFDNALLKCLASNFNRTYSIDMRHYEEEMGRTFKLKPYMEAHDIHKVLFIGNIDFFAMPVFNLEVE